MGTDAGKGTGIHMILRLIRTGDIALVSSKGYDARMDDNDHNRLDTPQVDTSTHGQTPDMSLDTSMSIREASARADVTEKTIRRWIKNGRLHAIKLGGQYRITLADLERARHDTGQLDIDIGDMSAHPLDTGQASPWVDVSSRLDSGQADVQEDQGAGTVDLRPLVEHIAELERQVGQLTEAATIWQLRAVQAEDQLKQLTAGGDTSSDAPGSPESASDGGNESTVEGSPKKRTVPLWRRLLDALRGS
jgi:excisionase family DNA binding protein